MKSTKLDVRGSCRPALMVGALAATLWLAPPRAYAQTINSFSDVTLESPMVFSVNGTPVMGQQSPSADISGLLASGAGSTNAVSAGFATSGSFIDLTYTGSGSLSWGSASVQTGDTLRVFGVFGVYLVEPTASGEPAALVTPATIHDWPSPGSGLTYDWTHTSAGTGFAGYISDSRSDGSNWLGYKPFGSFGGKDWTNSEKGQYGAFAFDNVTGGTAAYLGLDIAAVVLHNGVLQSETGSTGWVRITGLGQGVRPSGSVVPEGSSAMMMLGGLLPFLGGAALFRRRRHPAA